MEPENHWVVEENRLPVWSISSGSMLLFPGVLPMFWVGVLLRTPCEVPTSCFRARGHLAGYLHTTLLTGLQTGHPDRTQEALGRL